MTTTFGVPRAAFPSTVWTRLLGIRDRGIPASREQLEALFETYWAPVHAFILRDGWTRDADEARDLAQEFFLSLLERDFSRGLAPEKGRFRQWVKASLRNFLANRKRDAMAQKRGGGAKAVPLEEVRAPEGADPFDLDWRRALLAAAMERLRSACAGAGKLDAYEAFALHSGGTPVTHAGIAARLGMKVFDVGNRVKWARGEMRRIVLELIGEYARSPEEARRELGELFS